MSTNIFTEKSNKSKLLSEEDTMLAAHAAPTPSSYITSLSNPCPLHQAEQSVTKPLMLTTSELIQAPI